MVDIEGALNEAAQQQLVDVNHRLISVEPPAWLHLPERRMQPVMAPKPSFEKLD